MTVAALVTWIVTAGLGLFMLLRWLRGGGLRGGDATTHFPPARVFSHLGLAAGGLVLWILFLFLDRPWMAWTAFAALVLVAILGGLLVRRWTADGRAAMRRDPAMEGLDLAEQHIPRGPVVLHGTFAVATALLVLLTALGVGRG